MIKLLFILLSLGLASEWGTSFSVRTPNDDTKELDYELSIKLEDTDGDLKYLLKRDWERELGEKYIDNVVNLQHKVFKYINPAHKSANCCSFVLKLVFLFKYFNIVSLLNKRSSIHISLVFFL